MKRKIIRFTSLILSLLMLISLYSCKGDVDDSNAVKLSFKQALEYDYLKSIDGKTVTINGYLATSSPVDGSFIFLMNMPYQSCPFCVPNTSTLSNTMEVYPSKGEQFSYTNQAVKVVGKLEVAEDQNEPFTDEYGYEFAFKIVDAEYTILRSEDLSAEMALWQRFSSTDIINEVNNMLNYVDFICKWNEYWVNNYTDADGVEQKGYYLWPDDAKGFLSEGAQYSYGTASGYFDNIISQIKAVDPNAFSELVSIVERSKTLADEAMQELNNGNYTYEYQYVERFDTYDNIYTLNLGVELKAQCTAIYNDFSTWLSGWEL